ncbi:Kelch repeat-containing protein [Archangium lansingense]|uniref:Kelch-like protein n=1 Tax=Archangium lansingense TaxID=2995310 RepID=A0ABT4AJ39_9BACT|nr:kelch repeat-containing protein [Archangium lansinium]MCY1081722.1 kelch-like protein [Archangium lansinium]
MVQRMKAGWLWLAAVVLVAAGCTQPTESTTGSVQLMAVIQSATADEVASVLVTVTAPDMDPVTGSLVKAGGNWSGTLSSIPVGSDRTFTAEAFDAAGGKHFAGQATGVTVSGGTTAVVSITLQETSSGPGFENDVPRITSLVASSNRVAVGGSVSLQVTAVDYNAGDTLSYAWTSSAGSFDNTTSTSTTWTAPALAGSATVTVTVTDSRGASAALSLTLTVDGGPGQDGGVGGSASVGAILNSWPQVTRITASPSFIAMGEATTVQATASDFDGDALSYQWSSPWCSGTWTGETTRTATFTPSPHGIPPPSQDGCSVCALEVSVTDGRGGQTTGTLRMCVGQKPTASFPPRITGSTQSATTVAAGSTVTFRVTASDPVGSALSFQWSSFRGTLGSPLSGIASSEVVWTAPSCVVPSRPTTTVTASVKNAAGLSASTTFTVSLTGPACPPSTWVRSPPMTTERSAHTATLLPSGKVLVAGGFGLTGGLASSELYDPATDVWTSTGSLGTARQNHTATLLPSGKVLVVGGYATIASNYVSTERAELYDPATSTWSPVAGMSRGRADHTATLLPSGKVLVVGGYGGMSSQYDAELYDPAANTWTSAGILNLSRAGHEALVLSSGRVLVVGGTSYSTNNVEFYAPDTGLWSLTNAMFWSHYRTVVVQLSSGKVLVADTEGPSLPAEVYDPTADSWTMTGSLSAQRAGTVGVALQSGKALVMGGYDYTISNGYVASAELYDPAAGTWSSAGTMSTARIDFTATVLPSGLVLVAGGIRPAQGGGGIASSGVELYLP